MFGSRKLGMLLPPILLRKQSRRLACLIVRPCLIHYLRKADAPPSTQRDKRVRSAQHLPPALPFGEDTYIFPNRTFFGLSLPSSSSKTRLFEPKGSKSPSTSRTKSFNLPLEVARFLVFWRFEKTSRRHAAPILKSRRVSIPSCHFKGCNS